MQKNTKDTKQKDKKAAEPRYNEKQAFIAHLASENGVNKLLNTFRTLIKGEPDNKENNSESAVNTRTKKLDDTVNDVLDIFKAWVDEFPCKKFYKMSYYEILHKIEKYCDEKEIYEMFDYLF